MSDSTQSVSTMQTHCAVVTSNDDIWGSYPLEMGMRKNLRGTANRRTKARLRIMDATRNNVMKTVQQTKRQRHRGLLP
jgi:hypothetical protein